MNVSVFFGIILEILNVVLDLGNFLNDRGYGFEGGGDCFFSISFLLIE